jgi:hypothetical protein
MKRADSLTDLEKVSKSHHDLNCFDMIAGEA